MKHILITTIAAVVLVGCATLQSQEKTPKVEPPSISIHKAAMRGNIEAVKQHLDTGTDVNIARAGEQRGETALHFATTQEHKEIVELLIANSANVNAKNFSDITPLHWVKSKEIAEILVANGANVNARRWGSKGRTPLDNAMSKSIELMKFLLKHGAKHSFELNAEAKPVEPVSKAEKPEPPTTKSPDISIHYAAQEGIIEAVKQHLATGTDLNAKDEDGYTPLYAVAGGGHKEIAVLLIANGADVNAKNKYGETPLHYAATKEIAELLIAKGADVNAKDEVESTPLHTAALNGHKEVIELLIANGADVNAKDGIGRTPLDVAIANDRTEIADLLRKHGGKTGE